MVEAPFGGSCTRDAVSAGDKTIAACEAGTGRSPAAEAG